MARQLSGFRDKLYWRQVRSADVWHCFKKACGGGYVSLCDRAEIPKSGGQECRRPRPVLRCGICDGKEMDRRGWDSSGPTLYPRSERGSVKVCKGKKGTSVTFRGQAARDLFRAMGGDL